MTTVLLLRVKPGGEPVAVRVDDGKPQILEPGAEGSVSFEAGQKVTLEAATPTGKKRKGFFG